MRLKVEPGLRIGSEEARQPQRGIGSDGPLAVNNLIDAARRYADFKREPILAHAHRFEPFFQQNFAGGDKFKFLHHRRLLVVVHDLDIERRAAAPFKTQTPLIVDADAPLPFAITFQGFQPVLRRNP